MNAKITQGKRQLWQWDTGVQLMLFDIGTANEVHFATPDGVIRRDIVNNMCNIPDVVLQRAGTMVCYVFNREPYEGDTRHEFHFEVLPRPKPADYIDPPGEADYLDQLYDRLKDEIVGPPGPQGEQGQRGTGYLRILSKPADKVEMVDGKVVAHSLSLNIVKAEANVDEVRVGDCLLYDGAYAYPVVVVDVNVYTSKVIDLHGPAGPQGIEGERGEAGPAGAPGKDGVDGKDGTSVTITSIAESTEDDGYSVVTFSDGKQLKVKNGSKGSPGEGGSGGGESFSLTINFATEDMQNCTADKTFDEMLTAFTEGKMLYANLMGMIILPVVQYNSSDLMFSALMDDSGTQGIITLTATPDNTATMSVSMLSQGGEGGGGGGIILVNFTTEDGETFAADKTLTELNEAVANGQSVYMSFEGMVSPAQCINDSYAVFVITIPDFGDGGGKVTFVLMDTNSVTMNMSPEGGGGLVIVTVEDGVPSMTSTDISTATSSGMMVVCMAGSDIPCMLNPTIITEEFVIFTGIQDISPLMPNSDKKIITAVISGDTAMMSESVVGEGVKMEPLTIANTTYDGSKPVNVEFNNEYFTFWFTDGTSCQKRVMLI